MSLYRLELKANDPKNNISVKCNNAAEAVDIKKKAETQGYKVSISKVKAEQ